MGGRDDTGGPGRLVIITGLPGSGKTTLARTLAASMPACRMCPDEWMAVSDIDPWDTSARSRIEAFQLDLTLDLLRGGNNVAIEWGTWARTERDTLRHAARSIGASVELRYLTADIDELWRRIAARGLDGGATSPHVRQHEARPIKRHDLEEWWLIYEPPTEEEFANYDAHEAPPP